MIPSCLGGGTLGVVSQPLTGPGSQVYTHDAFVAKRFGDKSNEVWVFYPETTADEELSVVFFLHGWGGFTPEPYGAWIEHIVRNGNVVVFPRYQQSILTPIEEITAAAARGVQTAWREIMADPTIGVRTDRVGWVGHSLGAYLAANLATQSEELGLPSSALLMLVEPGSGDRLDYADLSRIPEDTLVIVADGDRDCVVQCDGTIAFMNGSRNHPKENLVRILMRSDADMVPALYADHFAPLARSEAFTALVGEVMREGLFDPENLLGEFADSRRLPDDLDFHGFWAVLDVLLELAFEPGGQTGGFHATINEASIPAGIGSRARFAVYDRPSNGMPMACAARSACGPGTP